MATKDEEDSLVLHATLDGISASAYVRLMRGRILSQMSLSIDVALILARQRGWVKEVKFLGSLGEGLAIFVGFTGAVVDSDMMLVSGNSLAYEHRFVKVPVSTWLFQIHSCTNNSGYVQLRLKQQGNVRLFNPDMFDMKSLFEYDTTSDCCYLTNAINQHYATLLPTLSMPFANIKASDSHTDVVNSGPCVTLTNPSVIPRMGSLGDVDVVIGIMCPEWPSVAVEWILRDRFNGWPAREFIDQQVLRGCYVIPVGCKECRKQLDWRISFAHVEQALVHSMNAQQINCFLLLRQLKKIFFEVKLRDVITSYIIKTTLFWTIEETSPDLWQSHKLLTAVKVCLNKLITFIQNDHCPHYFIRNCNLFIRRYSPSDKRNVLQTCLEVRRNPMEILCKTPPFAEEVQLRRSNQKLSSEYTGHEALNIEGELMTKLLTSLTVHFFQNKILRNTLQMKLSDMECQQDVKQYCIAVKEETSALLSNCSHACRDDVEVFEKYIHGVTQRLINSCQIGYVSSENTSPCGRVSLHNDTDEKDDVNSIANTCHQHVVASRYSRCNDIIIKFVAAQQLRVYSRFINEGTGVTGFEFNFTYAMLNILLIATDDTISCISDLIFLQVEEDTLPTPLQIELNPIQIDKPEVDTLLGHTATVLVDPLVYLCFLRFWCSMKMDQNIEQLKARDDMVWCCGLINISEKAVALNLLSFCHNQLQEYEEAFAVLCRAFRERPLTCSTLIHIATLINKKLNKT